MKNVEDLYPLSPLQQGLLFHALMEPESPAYVNQSSVTLRDLDPELFRQTWERVLARHAILRTAFFWESLKEPVQAVRERVKIPWEEQDWRALEPGERSRRLEVLRLAERSRPLSLARAPLMRFVLVRLEDEVHELIWTFHHLLLDGWSTPLLFAEVLEIYRALREGRQPALPAVRPFRDYIAWLQRRDLGEAEAFWRRYLAGFSKPTSLMPDLPGTAAVLSSEERSATLAPAMAAALQSLAVRHRLTLNTVGQGAWALLLSRYSGEEEVVFGSVVAGRPADLPGVESMVGLFINTLPVRVRVAAGQPAMAWLEQLQKQQIELRQYEHSPLSRVQGWSDVPPGQALFDSILACENYPREAAASRAERQAGLQVARMRTVELTGYALSATVAPADGLTVQIGYDPSRFDAAGVTRRVGHLCNLLEGLATSPGALLEDLPLLGAAERQQLWVEWSDTMVATPQADLAFPYRFEAQAGFSSEAVAASCVGERLNYGELEARAGRLARVLAGYGVGPETVVALLAERGLPLLTAILAVFKAGGAYLPLDPGHPAARQSQLLARSGASLLLAQRSLRDGLKLGEEAARNLPPVLEIEALLERPGLPFAAPSAGRCEPRNLAYVIFTSGSTGAPKGAMVEHRGMLNHLLAKIADLGLNAADVVVQSASQCFDISVWQLLAVLLVGGRVEIADDETARDPQRLLELVESERATILETVPSLLRGVLEMLEGSGSRPRLGTLRWLLVTGEAFPAELARRWLALYPAIGMLNAYGPTECSDDVTHWAVRRPPQGAGAQIPIGRPLANFRLDVLDRHFRPAPLGSPGELCVGGVGVGRGYLGEPGRTAEAFVPDPQGALRGEPGGRLYRTGDLVRRRPDGVLEFLGRIDHQVKVRGYRIELGEIEAALEQHPGVRAAVALAREDRPGQMRLVAYVVPAEQAAADAELREHLRARLPEYMVPAALVTLTELPLLLSGKVDRKALPEPEWAAPVDVYVAPRTAVEEALARIWEEVLRRERVGVHDSFFELGGDSILSIQILSRASRAGLRLTARQIFEHPTIADLAAIVQESLAGPPAADHPSGDSREPLVHLDPATLERVMAAETRIDDLYPASPVQQGMLFHTLRSPGSGVYVEQLSLVLGGDLDVAAFQGAWQALVDRQPVLRTSFFWKDVETPLQRVHGAVTLLWDCQDWRAMPAALQQTKVAAYLEESRCREMDLERPPLMRFGLLRTGQESYHFSWTFHHVLFDGWSMPILLRELFAFYEAGRRGGTVQLEPVRPYRDYIAWLAGQDLGAAEAFWRRSLAGFTAPTPLTIGSLVPDAPDRQVARARERSLPASLTEAFRSLARRRQLTLNTLVQGAWALLLSRYSGEEDVAFGVVTSGRSAPLAGIEETVGLFINTLPARVRVSPAAGWLDWLRELQANQLEVRQYEHSPLSQVQGWSEVPRGLPLFESVLAFENYPVDEAMQRQAGESLGVARAEQMEQTHYPVTLAALAEARLSLRLFYRTDRFDSPTVLRMLGHLEAVLTGMISHPENGPLSTLPLLTAAERHQLLAEWNAGGAAPAPLSVDELFAAQAAARPGAPAVVCAGQRLTYGELEAQANRLARRLRALGVGPEVPVGLCLERSLDLVVAVLGVFKAGGAYVPLDPLYPRERLAVILADARPLVLVTQERLLGALPETGAQLLCLDAPGAGLAAESAEPLAASSGPDDLAYVLFTSGSTGRPKGVLIEQGSLAATLAASRETFGWEANDVMACVAPFPFDIFLFELLNPLLAGGVCHLIPLMPSLDVERLVDLLPELTRLHAVPALMRQIVDGARRSGRSHPGLRTLFVGGDTVPPDLLAGMREVFPSAEIRVLYGPTEATIIATSWTVPAGPVPARSLIGRPLPGTEVQLRDGQGAPVPIGVAGEIWLGGAGVARGYLESPEGTAERFPVENGRRFYRTGDLARRLPGGELEFLGRADDQVKVRGFRIEPGDVEAALLALAGVRGAAVIARDDLPGGRGLFACVVLEEGFATSAAALREGLQGRLPEHMVPASFALPAALPLTAHGKVDRKALARMPITGAMSKRDGEAPRTPVEELLAGVFAEVLQTDEIDLEESFFAMGGHSLLTARIASQASRVLGIELPLRMILEASTVRALAEQVEHVRQSGAAAQLPPLARWPRDQRLPLSFPQQRLWRLQQREPGSSTYNIRNAVRLHGSLDVAALAGSLAEIVRRHEVLRTGFTATAGEPLQVIAPPGTFVLPWIDLSGLPEEARWAEVSRLRKEDANRSFDLARPPLLRAAVLELAGDDHIVLLTFHEIAFDGLSMGILVGELRTLYEAFRQRRPSPLPELAAQYADFAAWQRQWLTGDVLESELAYWRDRLGDSPEPLGLRTDRPGPGRGATRAGRRRIHIDGDLLGKLRKIARHQGATLFMTLLAAFQILLSRNARRESLSIGTPIGGRIHPQAEPLLGRFANRLVLRTSLAGNPTFPVLLDRVRETALGAYAHQNVPFERLLAEYDPDQDHSRLFQVWFSLTPGGGAFELPGLRVGRLPAEEAALTHFDLSLLLVEEDGQLGGWMVYRTALFERTTIERMASSLESLLASIAASPDRRISELVTVSDNGLDSAPDQPATLSFNSSRTGEAL